MTTIEKIPDIKPNLETREKPPSKWKNRFKVKAFFLHLSCTTCGTPMSLDQGDNFLSPHCGFWPSRDIAETVGGEEERHNPQTFQYMGAERVD